MAGKKGTATDGTPRPTDHKESVNRGDRLELLKGEIKHRELVRILLGIYADRPSITTESVQDRARFIHAYIAEDYRLKFVNTSNPVWVWRCLSQLSTFCREVSRYCSDLQDKPFVAEIPHWCMEYIAEISCNISALSFGEDHRQPRARSRRPLFAEERDIEPNSAMDRVSSALGLARQGWNGFREAQDEDFLGLIMTCDNLSRATGERPVTSVEEIMDLMGWTDERHARRKIAQCRRRRAKPHP